MGFRPHLPRSPESMAGALELTCAVSTGPGGYWGPPGPSTSAVGKCVEGCCPRINPLIYTLTNPQCCLDDGVHRPIEKIEISIQNRKKAIKSI